MFSFHCFSDFVGDQNHQDFRVYNIHQLLNVMSHTPEPAIYGLELIQILAKFTAKVESNTFNVS